MRLASVFMLGGLLVLSAPPLAAQFCSGAFALTSQAEVNAFDCVGVDDLRIGYINADLDTDITDLSPLARLETVTGALLIGGNPNLTSLEGLGGVRGTGGLFHVKRNNGLEDLSGLTMTGVEQLLIEDNEGLRSLRGLETIVTVEVRIDITGNDALRSLSGLDGVAQLRALTIADNTSLASLDGLGALTRVAGVMRLRGNAALLTMEGLDVLTDVQNFIVEDNDALESFVGLERLANVFEFVVRGNDGLLSFEGLTVPALTPQVLTIEENDALRNLEGLEGLRGLFALGIYENGALETLAGLDSLDNATFSTISGNPSLRNLNGLESLTSVGFSMEISDNTSLLHVDALRNVLTGDVLAVRDNPQLAACSCGLFNLIDSGGVSDEVVIERNAPGCNAPSELMEPAPGTCPTVVSNAPDALPRSESVLTAYPNPGATHLTFAVPAPATARLVVYDLLGRAVQVVFDGPAAQSVTVALPRHALPSGTYVARLTLSDSAGAAPLSPQVETRRFVVVR